MAWIAIVEMPSGDFLPIVKGDGDGPDALATWPTYEAAQEAMRDHPLGKAYGAVLLDLDEGY